MSQVRKPPWCHLLSAFQGQVVRRPFSISSEDALPSVAVPNAHHRGLDSVGASKDGYANFWFFNIIYCRDFMKSIFEVLYGNQETIALDLFINLLTYAKIVSKSQNLLIGNERNLT